jgi:hypothetical protein
VSHIPVVDPLIYMQVHRKAEKQQKMSVLPLSSNSSSSSSTPFLPPVQSRSTQSPNLTHLVPPIEPFCDDDGSRSPTQVRKKMKTGEDGETKVERVSRSPKEVCRGLLKQFWKGDSKQGKQVTECYMRVCNTSIQFADFLKFYGSLCNSARCGIVTTKKPLSYVLSRFSNDHGQPIVLEHVSGRGVTGFTVLKEQKQQCLPLGELRMTTMIPMDAKAIEEFVAESGSPCENVSICNEWRFQYKNSVIYRLLQVSEGSGKLEACQKVPDYFVDIFLIRQPVSERTCHDTLGEDGPPVSGEDGVAFERFLNSFLMKCSDLVVR